MPNSADSGVSANGVPAGRLHSRSLPLLLAGAVFLATFLVFSGAIRHDFVNWDDNNYILKNPHLAIHSLDDLLWHFTHGYFWSYVPLTMLSHSLDYALYGLSPGGHHLTSIVLHSANAVWLFILAYLLLSILAFRDRPTELPAPGDLFRQARFRTLLGAASAALLFALHPLKAESAAWVSDRKDLLCAFFLFPSAIAFLRYSVWPGRAHARGWLLLAVALHFLAVLSKATALMFPFVLLLLDLTRGGRAYCRPRLGILLREKIPFFLVSLIVGLIGVITMPDRGSNLIATGSAAEHTVLYSLYSIFHPLEKLLWPLGLSPLYDDPSVPTMLGALVLVLLATALSLFLLRLGKRWPVLAWSAYLVLSVPTALYFLSSIQPIADRYTYLPTVPFFILAGGAIAFSDPLRAALRSRRRADWTLGVATLAVTVLLSVLTVRQVAVWRSPLSLWQHAVSVAPFSPYVQNNLGEALVGEGYIEEALVAYQVAAKAKPDYADVYSNLGVIYIMKGNYALGLDLLSRALTLTSEGISSYGLLATIHYNIGLARKSLGDYDGAISHFESAIKILPTNGEAYTKMGEAMLARGDSAIGLRSIADGARLGDKEAARWLDSRSIRWEREGGK